MNSITVYNHGNLPTASIDEFQELQEDFKIFDPEKNMRLQMLFLRKNNFNISRISYELIYVGFIYSS